MVFRIFFRVLLCIMLWPQTVLAGEPLHLVAAQVLRIDGRGYTPAPYALAPGTPAGDWTTVDLPYAPRTQYTTQGLPDEGQAPTRTSWFRVTVPDRAITPPRYLYIARWKTDGQIAVYGDGKLLYQSHANLQWNGSNHPLFVALDSTADAKPVREVVIRLQHLQGIGGALSTLWVGNHSDLAWRYMTREWLQAQFPQMCSAAFLALGIFAFFVWFSRRGETLYLLFFLMSVVAFVRTFHLYVGLERLPISDEWFGWLTVNSAFWLLAIFHLFLIQLHHRRQTWLTNLAMGVAICSSLITLPLPGMPDATLVAPLTYVALLLLGNTTFAWGLFNAWRSRSKNAMLLAGWSLLCMQFGIHDWMLQNNFIDIEGSFLSGYANIGAFILFTYVMFRRYLAALSEVEQVNASLAIRLQAREEELTQSHQRLREIEQRQTLTQERQRLMQDMHDGLGSSLVSALRVVEHGRLDEADVAQVLKGCIDDLKLAIDSMESVEADVLLLLATLRFRLGPRLESSGIALRWDVKTVPPLPWLNPKNALHILRILQEAFTNIIKHTHASEIRLTTHAEDECVVITVADNGGGFDLEKALHGPGKGLSNQQNRARSIGARVDWVSSPAGTRLSLHLPLKQGALP